MSTNNQQVRVQLPSQSQVGSFLIKGTGAFVRKHPVISGYYALGLLILLLGGSGLALSSTQQHEYNNIMSTIDVELEYEVSSKFAAADSAYRSTKGWFSCDNLCTRNKRRMEDAKADLDAVRKEGYARMSDAKKVAGIFSEVGVSEVKDSFWSYFNKGKAFAKRQSMWDAAFMSFRSMGRNETMMEYLLKVGMQVMFNFTLGLVFCFFIFVFGLYSIVTSYQPNVFVAVGFFICATAAAFALVASFLMAMYGTAAGGLYGVAKVAEANMRLEGQRNGGGGGGYRQQNIGGGGRRAHWD